MKRISKNIIMILILLILIGGMVFTGYYAKKNLVNNSTSNVNNNATFDNNMTPPDMNNNTGETPPDMPGQTRNDDDDFDDIFDIDDDYDEEDDDIEELRNGMNRENFDGQRPQMPNDNMIGQRNMNVTSSNVKLTAPYIIIYGVLALLASMIIIYLLMSLFNAKTLKETLASIDKGLIFTLATILLTGLLTFGSTMITNKVLNTNSNNVVTSNSNDNTSTKQTTADDVETGSTVNEKTIDLSKYNENVTITEAGEYTLTGTLNNSVIVNADGDVTLNLNNVTITSSKTSAIANISKNKLTINLVSGSSNTLTDGGSSEYDGCIYSTGELTIDGDGSLKVYGKQDEGEGIATETNNINIKGGTIYIESTDDGINAGGDGGTITISGGKVYVKSSGDGIDSNKDLVITGGSLYIIGSSKGGNAGIDTDGGYQINGGTVVAIGTDMIEYPESSSKQNTIALTLNQTISSGTLVVLTDSNDKVVMAFEADENFKTLILSSDNISNGTYNIYTGGKISGSADNGIYTSGEYTKGTLLKTVNVSSTITKAN